MGQLHLGVLAVTDAEISAAWDAQASSLEDARRATGAHDPEMTKICLAKIQEEIPPSLEPLRLIEIGCGIGRLTFPVARACPRSTILAIDASPKMLHYAKTARAKHNIEGVRFMQSCRPGPYGFGEAIFDGAWTVLTLQHLEPTLAREYVHAVGRGLKIGGPFVFQFIQGTERASLSNHFSLEDVSAWCAEVGLRPMTVSVGDGHPLWTWVKAVKW